MTGSPEHHLTRSVVIGVILIVASFARDLLSLVADAIAVVGVLEGRLPVVDVIVAAPVRLALLVIGITLIGKSVTTTLAASEEDLSEQAFRASLGSSLESVLREGISALNSIPADAIPGRVNAMLWWFVRDHYDHNVQETLRRFKVVSRVPREVYESEGVQCYQSILALAETTKSVLGGRTDQTDELRLWFRRLELLDAQVRGQLGAARVDKARALASRTTQVREST